MTFICNDDVASCFDNVAKNAKSNHSMNLAVGKGYLLLHTDVNLAGRKWANCLVTAHYAQSCFPIAAGLVSK